MKLNDLSLAALKAAFQTGTDRWGQWGSTERHALYVEPRAPKLRRMCRCGCRKRATHIAAANGMCMSMGCELSMRRFVKEMSEARR